MATVSPFFAVDLSAETEPLSDLPDVETAFADELPADEPPPEDERAETVNKIANIIGPVTSGVDLELICMSALKVDTSDAGTCIVANEAEQAISHRQ